MIRSIFILTIPGDIIIEKHYGGYLNRSVVDYFIQEVGRAGSLKELPPVIPSTRYFLANINVNDLFFLAPIQGDYPPLLVIEFLYRVAEVFKDYFKEVSEDSLKNNFTTVYNLLDELMDSGMPFMTEYNILREMIHPPSIIDMIPRAGLGLQLPEGALTNIPWRRQGVKYTNNEIFFDIYEEVDAIIDANGLMVSSQIAGRVEVVSQLTGFPDLSLRFSNPRMIDDCSFHPCVRYSRWENERNISFIPPDGSFTLMKYRIFQQIQPPIYCKPTITFDQYGGKVTIMVGPKACQGKLIEDVVITIPFPQEITSTTLTSQFGTVSYDEISRVCTWKIGKIPKDKTPMLSGTVSLAQGSVIPETRPTCIVQFRINLFSASGLKVDSLNLVNEPYKPYKGVRFITESGKFQARS